MQLCGCGAEIISDEISCSSCGKRLTLDPFIAVNFPKEPPVNSWRKEIEGDGRSYSDESMREVREEAKKRTEAKVPNKEKWPTLRFVRNEILAFFSKIWMFVLGLAGLFLAGIVAASLYVIYTGGLAFLPERAYNYVVAEFEEVPNRLLPSVPSGGGTEYKFLHFVDSGIPITWDPCVPISYVINPDEMPANGKELIQSAADSVSTHTGLKFVNVGETNESLTFPRQPFQPSIYPSEQKSWAPVLVSWLPEEEFKKELEKQNLIDDAIGFAGPNIAYTDDYFDRKELLGPTYFVSGTVTLNSNWFNSKQALSNPDEAQAVLMHEFGHLVGLDHATSQSQLMASENNGLVDFGDGDKAGLAKLGSGSCAKPHERPQVREIFYELE